MSVFSRALQAQTEHPFPWRALREKAVALKALSGRNPQLVKKTHKGPLRDVLARNMRRLCAARSLSQEALAHECGINRTCLSGSNERNASIDNIARVARA